MNRDASDCLFGGRLGLLVFLAPDESEERKKRIDVMLITLCVMLMQCCNEQMKGLRREIVMIGELIGVPLQIILDVTITSSTSQLKKSGEEERGERAKSAY